MSHVPFRNIMLCFFCLTNWVSFSSAQVEYDTNSIFLDPEDSEKISMDFQNASLVDVLKIFSQQTKMNLVTAEGLANKTITVYLDKVPVEMALDQVLRANDLTYEIQHESNIYIVKSIVKPEVELITRVYKLRHASVPAGFLKQTLTIETGEKDTLEVEENADSSGIVAALGSVLTDNGHVIEDAWTNSLIVTDIASNFPKIETTIAKLDVMQVQILIEVEMLEVTKETADLIGIKIGDTPLTFSGAQRDHVYPWDQNELLRKGYEFEDAEYRVGTIDASGLTATLQALRTNTETRSLARPRILTLNNQAAQIKIATDEAIGSIVSQTAAEGVGTSSVEAERVETGVFLTVTPQAIPEKDELIMAVAPKVIIARSGATFSGITFRDPEERGSQSILRVKSGDTIILGGLMREDLSETITKVPIIGDIPLIGRAFRHKNKSVTERELIIFITPHILKDRTSSSNTTVTHSRPFFREQDNPTRRNQDIKDKLAIFEN